MLNEPSGLDVPVLKTVSPATDLRSKLAERFSSGLGSFVVQHRGFVSELYLMVPGRLENRSHPDDDLS